MANANEASQMFADQLSNSAGQSGLLFIIATSSDRPDKGARKLIRSHVLRGRHRSQRRRRLPSWIKNGDNGIVELEADEAYPTRLGPVPGRVGSDFSLTRFPEAMKPYMVQDVVNLLTISRDSTYPLDVFLQVDPKTADWFSCFTSDIIFFHSMLFSAQLFQNARAGIDQGPLTLFHGATTFRLLQERVSLPDIEASTSDATIMTVFILAVTAELTGDRQAAMNHREGLFRMVTLRGGLRALDAFDGKLRTKVCRADLCIALCFGCKPIFFQDGLSWDPYIATRGLIRRRRLVVVDQVSKFIQTLDERVANVMKDLHEFSLIANVAYQTERKIDPSTFNEIMVSIMYRLLHLTFEIEPVNEVIRVGMITFATTIFLQWNISSQRYEYMVNLFRGALLKARASAIDLPPPIQLWLLFTWGLFTGTKFDGDWYTSWLCEVIELVQVRTWDEARKVLKSVVWIDFLHDPHGKRIFQDSE